jgi:hypothetical protein
MPAIDMNSFRLLPHVDKQFLFEVMRKHPNTTGLIIIEIDDDTWEPLRYLHDDGESFCRFNSETQAEDPKTFLRGQNADRRVCKLIKECPGRKFIMAYWFHPDMASKPLEKYQKMTGKHFPGSPTQ